MLFEECRSAPEFSCAKESFPEANCDVALKGDEGPATESSPMAPPHSLSVVGRGRD